MLKKWRKAVTAYFDRRTLAMILLGFSSGFPLLLVLGTLNLWLKDSGISYAVIGLFSLVKIPYSLKWAWSPIIDRVKLPFFGRLGRRRGWALFTQILLFLSLIGMASIDPAKNPWILAGFAVFVAFASASQDIVLDAYRIENYAEREQGIGVASFVMGYRFGVLFSGAVALFLAEGMSWNNVYYIMSLGAVVGIITMLCSREPVKEEETTMQKLRGTFAQRASLFMKRAVVEPFTDFAKRTNWLMVLVFIFLYKMSDAYIGPMAYPFYDDMGFSKVEIAMITKIFGMFATVVGSIIGGIIVSRYGLWKALIICGVFQGISNLMFVLLAYAGHDTNMLIITISVENISGGMATTAFVAYLSSLCNVLYTATQYALLSSLMSLARDVVASSSGFLKETMSWDAFFIITTLMSIPGLILLFYMKKQFKKP